MLNTDDSEVTTAQIAKTYGVSVRTVHRRVAAGDLTPIRKFPGPTGGYLFSADEAERVFGQSATAA